ncbi:MAG: glycoside hydrolase family 10 protein, partial [Casimicrobiaceae bacterium]
ELLALLDRVAALNMNAVILQVRPSADALYPSALEPWSEYLTGQQGRAPEPRWDPLARWIEAAHARGLELHAWINPYRARAAAARGVEAESHVARRLPSIVRRYGEQLWLDPAEPEAQAYTLAVARDLLTRYDLDGLHIDDYFYPYPIKGRSGETFDFPDEAPWQRYLAAGGTLSRADWRRAQVNVLVEQLHLLVRAVRPQARFGISPFGLPRPGRRPPGITGFSQYDELYADVEHWLARGWLDYLAPQLYWPRAQTAQAFEPLLRSWLAANTRGRHVFPGLYTSRLPAPDSAAASTWAAEEILGQIELARRVAGESPDIAAGHVHFSASALLQDRDGIATRLARRTYAAPALAPRCPWLEGSSEVGMSAPEAPRVAWSRVGEQSSLRLQLTARDPRAFRHVVAWRGADAWQLAVFPAAQTQITLTLPSGAGDRILEIAVSAVDRQGIEGAARRLTLP